MNWKKLERHPLSAEYDDISGKQWEQFVARVRTHGIVNGRKIVLHENKVIDGWQLHRACVEADVTPDYKELKLPKKMTVEEWVEVVNDNRRHESMAKMEERAKERRERSAKAREEGKSLREIADEEGVSLAQTRRDLEEGVPGGTPDENSKNTANNGKNQNDTKDVAYCTACTTRKRKGQEFPKSCADCKELRKPKGKFDDEEEETPEPTIDDDIKAVNHKIESFCRKVMKLVESDCPKDVWLDDMGRRDAAIQKFKDACSTLRTAKSHGPCPKCAGDGCKECKQSGRVTKLKHDQMA